MSIMVRSLLPSVCSTTSPLGNVNGPSSGPVEDTQEIESRSYPAKGETGGTVIKCDFNK